MAYMERLRKWANQQRGQITVSNLGGGEWQMRAKREVGAVIFSFEAQGEKRPPEALAQALVEQLTAIGETIPE